MKLHIKNLEKKFDKKEIFSEIDITFEQGKIYGLLGKNGAGKTTLFNCINGDLEVDRGEIVLESYNEVHPVTHQDIGYVLSSPVVPEFLTGREFLKFFLEVNKGKVEEGITIDEYFDLIRIEEEDRDKLLKDYSMGMKNKMQMLTSIIAKPAVLLLDEPLTSFDVLVAEEMKELLLQLKKQHIIIFSTHIMDLAVSLCDEIVILNDGALQNIEKEHLDATGLKEQVIQILRGGQDEE